MSRGSHNNRHEIDYSDPARPCRCDDPAADPREMTCIYCGHQIAGVPLPSSRVLSAIGDHSTFAAKKPRHAAY